MCIRDSPIGEAMNSLEFKSTEGAMYENAAYAGNMMRSEQMRDVLVSEAAARHGLRRPTDRLPTEAERRTAMAAGVAKKLGQATVLHADGKDITDFTNLELEADGGLAIGEVLVPLGVIVAVDERAGLLPRVRRQLAQE